MANKRYETHHPTGKIQAGKLFPATAVPVLPGERGMITQNFVLETLPIAGRLISQMHCEIFNVFVPVEAITKLLDPEDENAGITEVVRNMLLSGSLTFPQEAPSTITKACKIEPAKVAGAEELSSITRLAHNAAVNFIRRSRYVYATQIAHGNTDITPAILSESILAKMNGALDPDEHVNGSVQLSIPTMALPVSGVGIGAPSAVGNNAALWSDGETASTSSKKSRGGTAMWLETDDAGVPKVFAVLDGIAAGGVNLTDLKNAQSIDRITRTMRAMIDANPETGEEIAKRWAHGLKVEKADQPFFLYAEDDVFGLPYQSAADGEGMVDDIDMTKPYHTRRIAFPVPQTELGGMIVTFIAVKPDEVIERQPHPILSQPWILRNHVAESLELDPIPVTMRELSAEVLTASETTVAFYTGKNELLKRYVNYGFNGLVDPETVESKNQIWQYAIPPSVTPDNIVYPASLDTYPWVDQTGNVVTYAVETNVAFDTPLFFGPSPVETVDVIDDADLFDQDED